MKILLLEDEESIRKFIVINLRREGYEVLEAGTVKEAESILDSGQELDIAILDVMLPDGSGMDVCHNLRRTNKNIGIIMLTAKAEEEDKVKGLESGADDYVTKPFSPAELMARVKTLLRRIKIGEDCDVILCGDFKFELNKGIVHKGDEEIELTPIEFDMIKFFVENPNKALHRNEILDKVWGENYFGDYKIVDVNIRRLRQKIENDPSEPEFIETVWGRGYRWRAKCLKG